MRRHVTETYPRIAVVIVGELRSSVREDYRAHQFYAIYRPLLGLWVDTYMALTAPVPEYREFQRIHAMLDAWYEPQFLSLMNTSEEVLAVNAHLAFSHQKSNLSKNLSKCIGLGMGLDGTPKASPRFYYAAFKSRICMKAIQRFELTTGSRYDFVLKARPDVEYTHSVPLQWRWKELSSSIVWDTAGPTIPTESSSVKKRRQFVADWVHVLPRGVADAFLHDVASRYDECIPREAPEGNPCGHAWMWPECRFIEAMHSLPNMSIAKLFAGYGNTMDEVALQAHVSCAVQLTRSCSSVGLLRCTNGWRCSDLVRSQPLIIRGVNVRGQSVNRFRLTTYLLASSRFL